MFDFPHPEFAWAIIILSCPMLWSFASLAFETAEKAKTAASTGKRETARLLSDNFDKTIFLFLPAAILMNLLCLFGMTGGAGLDESVLRWLWMPAAILAMTASGICQRAEARACEIFGERGTGGGK